MLTAANAQASKALRTSTRTGGGRVRRLVERPSAVAAAVFAAVVVAATIAAPLVAPHAPNRIHLADTFASPSLAHFFGTDELGRDLFTRVLYAGRVSLFIAGCSVAIAMLGGTGWGFVSAIKGGWIGELLMRTADVALGMPAILVGLVLIAAFGASVTSLVLIIGVVLSPATARIGRSALLGELSSEYYSALVATGASRSRILLAELLPNTMPVLLARASIVAADAIFIEASLSFVGLGIQPPTASWGSLLHDGYSNLYRSTWYVLFPALTITLVVLALNTLGDNLQRVLDPGERA